MKWEEIPIHEILDISWHVFFDIYKQASWGKCHLTILHNLTKFQDSPNIHPQLASRQSFLNNDQGAASPVLESAGRILAHPCQAFEHPEAPIGALWCDPVKTAAILDSATRFQREKHTLRLRFMKKSKHQESTKPKQSFWYFFSISAFVVFCR